METMQELFYRDPYAREFSATVTACREGKKGFEVVLSDTAFYPEGGGQPSDEGTLGDAKVTFVKRIGSEVVHYTDKPLEVGSTVTGKLDWDRRFDNMQNHTCEHISPASFIKNINLKTSDSIWIRMILPLISAEKFRWKRSPSWKNW